MIVQSVSIVKEVESAENPESMEIRVAIVPEDVKKLVQFGLSVFVESSAGEGMGIPDEEYRRAGAVIETHDQVYRNKDLIVKFKGPAMADIDLIDEGSILFCMAHFYSFPHRAAKLKEKRINVIAMEEVLESPKFERDLTITGKQAMEQIFDGLGVPAADTRVYFVGCSPSAAGAIWCAGNRNPLDLGILQADITRDEIIHTGPNVVYFLDSRVHQISDGLAEFLARSNSFVFDLAGFALKLAHETIRDYRVGQPPFEFGKRRIQCLDETGRAGAKYGVNLLRSTSLKKKSATDAKVIILGYGNVAMGAVQEVYDHGVKHIRVLGRRMTANGVIEQYIHDADIIINAAEQPPALRGVNYLITKEHTQNILEKGTIVIDLIGGSPTNRSPVENVTSCTFLTNPYFEADGILFAAQWGWPMLGFIEETAYKYSKQIRSVLIDEEKMVLRFDNLPPGLKRALVCGPFERKPCTD